MSDQEILNPASGGLFLPQELFPSPQSMCWPHRFKAAPCSICVGSGCRYCWQSGLDPYRASCLDCGGSKCEELGCQHLGTIEDMCPEHVVESTEYLSTQSGGAQK